MSTLPGSLPEPDNAPLRGGPVLRWGVLAPGAIAEDWVSALHTHTDQRVVAVASRTAERAVDFAARHGIGTAYGSYEALLAADGVDVVYIAAPHSEHRRIALLAIEAGKHVLIEKPIAVSEAEARDIVDAARAAGVFAMEALWSRFLPQTTIIARLLADGVLGRPRFATAQFGGTPAYDPNGRLFNPALAGGSLLDLGVYTAWFVTFALGDPRAITAHGSLAPTGVDEQATIAFDFERAAGIATSSLVARLPVAAMIGGESAQLLVDEQFYAPQGFRVVARDSELRWTDPSALRRRDGLCYQAIAVAEHIAAGRTEAPEHPLEASLRVMRILDEARRQLGAA